ncbi:MAG: XrtA/PEP-CTERM system histidine kinase PrsK [Methylococcaceae bacterium]
MSFMENYSYYSYITAAVGYFLLLPISLKGVKNNPVAIPFIVAVSFSSLWAGFTAFTIQSDALFAADSLPYETLRNASWFFLLSTLISRQQFNNSFTLLLKSRPAHALMLLIVFVLALEIFADFREQIYQLTGQVIHIRLFVHVLFAIIGLVMVEQIYRNAVPELRWAVKFLCLSLGASFVVDFILYSKSLLFAQIDSSLWNSRGFINALVVPLLAIAMHRLQTNDVARLSVSRKMVFHSTVLFSTGMYLVLMSLAGFYIKNFGGDWGEVAQIIFIFLAALVFSVLFTSGKIRALAKFYFNKHFFHYHYDYREEWIKLSKSISQLNSLNQLSGFIIKTMTGLFDSSGGGLWLKNEQGDFYLAESKTLGFDAPELIGAGHSLLQFMEKKHWVIDFVEFSNTPEVYDEVDLSQWSTNEKKVWLIIPLFLQNELEAFVVLSHAKVLRALNWEDHDLLKTVGMQLANALALSHASDALSRSRQFEAYNQISAYLVHDLKNLVAQISLIVTNADKHKHNPDFIDDSIETLENVVNKIDHLLAQLKKGQANTNQETLINLAEIIADVAIQQAGNKPALELKTSQNYVEVFGEKNKITAILGHLVQNAQDATPDNGFVRLELNKDEHQAIITVIDNGSGMDNKFIAERLFKPFDTTKGNAGMGIGVYEARDYIVKHAGTCVVESQPGKGTRFIIRLPLARQV